MDRKIRVGAVSYLNTKPLIFGFEQGMMSELLDLVIDYPSRIADLLLNNEIDLGLVPVAILPEMKDYHIVSDYCISSDGEVASVGLFSDVPVQDIETVILDYQSRTSVELAKVLLKNFWKIEPAFQNAWPEFQKDISGTTAAVLIGDRAFEQRLKSKYFYDLGAAWKAYAGLPFVFAAWVSNKPLSKAFIDEFNIVNAFGLSKIDKVVQQNPYHLFDLKQYYTEYICYKLGPENQKGLDEFLSQLSHKSGKQIAF